MLKLVQVFVLYDFVQNRELLSLIKSFEVAGALVMLGKCKFGVDLRMNDELGHREE